MQRKWKRNWRKEALRRVCAGFLAGLLLLGGYSTALAAPQGGTVAAGSATISQNGALTTINQASQKAVINWNSFGIAKGETVRFNQPGASSIALNRVTGNNASAIYGTLSANGQVFLVNPNGVLFAKGAQVNVGGLAASMLGISDKDFLNGNYQFSGDSSKSVVNQGELSAAAKGYIALLGANVANEGVIVAKEGTAALGAGSKVNLDFNGDGLLHMSVDKEAVAALASNKGLIQADGGLVVMSAKSADALAGTVVNNSGVIEAKSISAKNGVIRLEGGTNGSVVNSGTLNASGLEAGQTGGTVKVLGDKVSLTETAVLNVSGDTAGGTIRAGGNYQGSGSEQRAKETSVAAGASLAADAVSSGNGGTVVVWADKNTNFGGTISAKGGSASGDGGKVETSGKQKLTVADTAKVDTTAAKGQTGNWLLDPEDFTIGTGATGANYWNNSNLQTALGSSDVTIATTQNQNTANGTSYDTTSDTGNGDINILAPLNWSANKLTLSAYRNINIKSTLSATGTSSLDMTSGTGGSGSIDYGLTAFGFAGKVNFDRSGSGFLTINGSGYNVINSLAELQGFQINNNGVRYYLGTDLDASATVSTPVGSSASNSFRGVFDGGGHTISSLNINQVGQNNTGLFGYTDGAKIANLGMTGGSVTGSGVVGGLIGYMNKGSITNSYNTGNVTNSNASGDVYVGGLAGYMLIGSITSSYNTGNVSVSNTTGTANTYGGGLVGFNQGVNNSNISRITNSYNAGSITVSSASQTINVGGLAGYMRDYTSIMSSYNTGSVIATSGNGTANTFVGGLMGYMYNGNANIKNSYNTGSITANGTSQAAYVGGLAGINRYRTNGIKDSYNTGNVTAAGTSGTAYVGGLAGLNTGNITNSYTTGYVDASGASTSYIGGLAGGNADPAYGGPGTIGNSYWDTILSGISDLSKGVGNVSNEAGVTGLTTAQMKAGGWYNNWDTDLTNPTTSAWYLNGGHTAPLLRSFLTTLTVSADAANKEYNGSAAFGPVNQTYSLANYDSNKVKGTLAWSGNTNAGEYGLSGLYTTDQQGYLISYDSAAKLIITPKELTISGSRVYDGTTNAAAGIFGDNGTIATGVGSQSLTLSGNGVLGSKNVGDATMSSLGSLVLNDGANGGKASNYKLSVAKATASISPATVTIAAQSDSKTYDGNTSSYMMPIVSGLITSEGDSISGLTQTYDNKNAGSGKRLSVAGGYTIHDGNSGRNYQVVTIDGAGGLIRKAPLMASLTGTVEKVYDGNTSATLQSANGILTGLLGSDVVTVSGSGSYNNKNVDSGKTVTVAGVSLAGADAGNYELSSITGSVNGTITKAPLTLFANDARKTYDKLPYSGGNGVSGSGFAAGEGLGDLAGTLTYGGNSQGAVEVGKYGISVRGLTSSNYDITFRNGTLTVNKAAMSDPAYIGAVQNSQQSGAIGPQERSGSTPGAAQTANLRYADGSIGRTLSVSGAEVTIGGGLVQVNLGAASNDVAVYTPGGQRTVYRFDAAHSVLSLREESHTTGAAPVTVAGVGESAPFELLDAAGHTAQFVLEHYGSGATVTAQNEAARGMLNQSQLLAAAALAAGQDQLGLEAEEMKELLLR